ncbi:hypothetical protein AQUCO_00400607v1 [Aquilegia coerulea]|uniref:Protein NDH-DEPENDENT CYCLIC ELECTRON FLOW 5 n=1 Tax=Aquilegia coerulea TaxID=218851 RepID=A0A2G5EVU0_AQUCA|nr:hypothetical protein AQUCO_00400607v1 [Aquilegia coerulea]
MAMANISHLFSPNFILTPTKTTKLFYSAYHPRQQRDFSVLAMASSSIPLNNVEYLEREFKGQGVSFEGIGDSCVVRMRLDNGSVASLMVPSGLITSYKAHMWHGSTVELLHTIVLENEDGGVVVRGGMSTDFECRSDSGVTWSPSTWVLHDVRGDAESSIEVELRSSDSENMVELKNIVSLQPDALYSQVVITNSKSSPLLLMGYIMSHLAVSTPDASFAVGLEGSDYYSKSPFISDFSIIPPEISKSKTRGVFQGLLSNLGRGDEAKMKSNFGEIEKAEGEEKDNYAQLTEKMSRIYTSAPQEFTILDRGKRNSVAVGTTGFDELYIFSPGSSHEWYGKYAFICTGPSAMLKPIVLNPNAVWRGEQILLNPNL